MLSFKPCQRFIRHQLAAEALQRAEDIIIEDAPCIFLYHSRGMVPHGPDVMGMKLSMTTPTVRPENIWLSSQRRS